MKTSIRRIIDREKPAPKRGGYHRSLTLLKPVKIAHYLGSIADTQTPEQRRARELEAELKAQQSAAAILLRRLVRYS